VKADASFADLVDIAKMHDVQFRPVKMFHFPTFLTIKKPFIALIQPSQPHYVVVYPKKRYVHVFDPSTGELNMSHEAFWKIFTQYALIPANTTPRKNEQKEPLFQLIFVKESFIYIGVLLSLVVGFLWIEPWKGQWSLLLLIGLVLFGMIAHRLVHFRQLQKKWLNFYIPKLINQDVFHAFITLTKDRYVDSLRSLIHGLTFMVILIYLSSISWMLMVLYGAYLAFCLAIDVVIYPLFIERSRAIGQFEKNLVYPMNVQDVTCLQKEAFRYTLMFLLYHSLLLVTGCGILLAYMWRGPSFHFSYFLTGFSIFMTVFSWLDRRRHHRDRRFQRYNQMDTILNPK
jgi:MFS family permease